MKATLLILSFFESAPDGAAIKLSSIIDSTDLKSETVRTTLKRLVAKGVLCHIGHGYYSKDPSAKVPKRVDRIAALEARVKVLEGLVRHFQVMKR